MPVAWHVQRGGAKGSWNEHWRRLLGLLREALGDGWQVLVLSDRGLESKELFEAITALGWHPLMRAKKGGHFRPDGWAKGLALGRFVARGGRWRGRGVAWPGSPRQGRRTRRYLRQAAGRSGRLGLFPLVWSARLILGHTLDRIRPEAASDELTATVSAIYGPLVPLPAAGAATLLARPDIRPLVETYLKSRSRTGRRSHPDGLHSARTALHHGG